jgi:zinc transport system substrate-binding protein
MLFYRLKTSFLRIAFITAWLVVLSLSACEPAPETQVAVLTQDGPLSVYTVNYPLAWMAERIGGEHVRVSFPAPADIDPAFWKPAPAEIIEYQQADLILLNGAGYAAWVTRSSLPSERLIDTAAAFNDQLIRVTDAVQHKHGPEGEHSHGDVAFTVWLNPELAELQARAILNAMVGRRPQFKDDFIRDFESLLVELQDLGVALCAAFDFPKETTIVFSHPVYQYLAKACLAEGMDTHTLTWEPDVLLTPQDLAALPGGDGEGAIKILVWEAEPLPANRQALAAQGFTSVVFSPVANRPPHGDYLDMMKANIARAKELRR